MMSAADNRCRVDKRNSRAASSAATSNETTSTSTSTNGSVSSRIDVAGPAVAVTYSDAVRTPNSSQSGSVDLTAIETQLPQRPSRPVLFVPRSVTMARAAVLRASAIHTDTNPASALSANVPQVVVRPRPNAGLPNFVSASQLLHIGFLSQYSVPSNEVVKRLKTLGILQTEPNSNYGEYHGMQRSSSLSGAPRAAARHCSTGARCGPMLLSPAAVTNCVGVKADQMDHISQVETSTDQQERFGGQARSMSVGVPLFSASPRQPAMSTPASVHVPPFSASSRQPAVSTPASVGIPPCSASPRLPALSTPVAVAGIIRIEEPICKERFWCKVCNTVLYNLEMRDQHVHGRRHSRLTRDTAKLRALSTPAPVPAAQSEFVMPVEQSAAAESLADEVDEPFRTSVHRAASPSPTRGYNFRLPDSSTDRRHCRCDTCNKELNSTSQTLRHLAGRPHARRLEEIWYKAELAKILSKPCNRLNSLTKSTVSAAGAKSIESANHTESAAQTESAAVSESTTQTESVAVSESTTQTESALTESAALPQSFVNSNTRHLTPESIEQSVSKSSSSSSLETYY